MSASEETLHVDPVWKEAVAKYRHSNMRISLIQVANTLIPYFALWYLTYRSMDVSYALTLLLAIPTAGFHIRTFILFHDCGHGSFFKEQKYNDLLGIITGVLTFTPYYLWRHNHAVHHATSGDLDRRGTGDIWTLTVEEYKALPPMKKLAYRLYRHPLTLLVLAGPVTFLVLHRFVRSDEARPRERNSVYWTNAALVVVVIAMSALLGLREGSFLAGFLAYVKVQLPILWFGTSFGVWLFYVQHQYEGTYWRRHEEWDYPTAALHGSSYYKLPRLVQWFSGNIGFHHIHHLSARIPNYYLETCYDEQPVFHVEPLTMRESLKSLRLHLWDEERRRLVGFGEVTS